MCTENETIQCALGMGLSNVPWDLGLAIVHLGMDLANVPWDWDYPM